MSAIQPNLQVGRTSPSWPSAASTVVGVIGDPISHSLSPLLHNAAFDALGLDWVSAAFAVASGAGEAAIKAMRALSIRGLSVTMPHKQAAARSVDRLTDTARLLGAVNCVTRSGLELVGDSTDGQGFLDSLAGLSTGGQTAHESTGEAGRRAPPFNVMGSRCLVIGAGGAARAVIAALSDAGAGEVVVLNRTESRAIQAASLAPTAGRVGGDMDVSAADLIVNATPAGMTPSAEPLGSDVANDPAFDVSTEMSADVLTDPPRPEMGELLRSVTNHIRPGQLVCDLIYHPPTTPFLAVAAGRGATVVNGLGMLVHQAARAVELWTGRPAPVGHMWDVATEAQAARTDSMIRNG